MTKALLVTAFVILMFGHSSSYGGGERFTLTIRNDSSRDFSRLYMSWSRDKDWGSNRLASPLTRGTAVALRDIVPADYDLLFVDADENRCVLRNFPIYNDRVWSLTDDWLARNCQRKA